jgi:hypothetical protein
MNNVKSSMIVIAAIATLLVVGTSLIPLQSYADGSDQPHKNLKSKSDSRTNQHLDQDNFCYRSPGCVQGNQGAQISGNDNTAKGFNDQSSQGITGNNDPSSQGITGLTGLSGLGGIQ